jgi:hypothetical protein
MHREWWQIWKPNDWLVAHHMDYRAWEQNPGNEPMSDLISLCRSHHDEVHARHRAGQFGADADSLRRCTMHVVKQGQRRQERRAKKLARKA